ncbi:MAG: AAA family ATPase [Flavobacteriaceae bacterium]|nr:AAA family ATPase [Flavobacteriaceae bacterium]
MVFKRHLVEKLKEWKSSTERKPLILRGARQVGKTTLITEFSKFYRQKIIINLEETDNRKIFDQTDDVHQILENLFFINGLNSGYIEDTLLFLDEIQEAPKAIQLLRYFFEYLPQLHVIAAGSLLEFALKDVKSFPVGRVEFLYIHPLNFTEYLMANEKEMVIKQLNHIPIKSFAHNELMRIFNRYLIIGGMPEIIKKEIQGKMLGDLVKTYEGIWMTYANDFEKYASNNTIKSVSRHLMSNTPYFIDQRIKFQNFGKSDYKSREVSQVFRRLSESQIIRLVYPTTSVEPPIIPDYRKSPKLQFLDIGILNHLLEIQGQMLSIEDLSGFYRGSLIPQIIFQELISMNHLTNHIPKFWVRTKNQSSSEVDLVQIAHGKMIPIEIKSGKSGKLKSLHQFIEACDHPYAMRIYGGEFFIEKTQTPKGKPFLLMSLPYYLGTKLHDYLSYFVQNYNI